MTRVLRHALAIAMLLAGPAAASAEAEGSSPVIPEEMQRDLEAEMARDRVRETEAQQEWFDAIRDRFDRNLAPSAESAREIELDRELDNRFPGSPGANGADASIPGCFGAVEELREHPDRPTRHRALKVRDFSGARPDGPRSDGAQGVAKTAVDVVCIGRAWVAPDPDGGWRATPTHMQFLAVFLRNASWWDPQVPNPSWRLRHEQVHFDLAEVVARNTTTSLREVLDLMSNRGDSPEAAVADLGRRFQTLVERARQDLTGLEARYDRETVHGSEVTAQAAWIRRVGSGLERSAAGSRSP